ncbi:hypothetical protein V1279_003028 [Bradyrhizobium sp. AZCC 1610]|uniref:hypothetical protein n=1 Tax=Bradyrhizobium sp. AZCC 1610 TaxID=3117020 RepID=UPI002FEEE1D1
MSVGVHCIVVGVLLLIAAAAFRLMKLEESRVSGFDDADLELLNMPAHERIAKDLAKLHGYPEFMWRRFTPLAVTILLMRGRNAN